MPSAIEHRRKVALIKQVLVWVPNKSIGHRKRNENEKERTPKGIKAE